MKMKATAPRRGALADDAAMIPAGDSSVMSCACGCGRRDWQRAQINARTAWIAMQGSPWVPGDQAPAWRQQLVGKRDRDVLIGECCKFQQFTHGLSQRLP